MINRFMDDLPAERGDQRSDAGSSHVGIADGRLQHRAYRPLRCVAGGGHSATGGTQAGCRLAGTGLTKKWADGVRGATFGGGFAMFSDGLSSTVTQLRERGRDLSPSVFACAGVSERQAATHDVAHGHIAKLRALRRDVAGLSIAHIYSRIVMVLLQRGSLPTEHPGIRR
jgi:hypothetical protein